MASFIYFFYCFPPRLSSSWAQSLLKFHRHAVSVTAITQSKNGAQVTSYFDQILDYIRTIGKDLIHLPLFLVKKTNAGAGPKIVVGTLLERNNTIMQKAADFSASLVSFRCI